MGTSIGWIVGFVALALLGVLVVFWTTAFRPQAVEDVVIHCADATLESLKPGQPIKVMTYNVQYFASKNYVFFYDLPDMSGPDWRPSREDIHATFHEVARVIVDESPDFVLLQEVDHGSRRTYHEDQLQSLLSLLPNEYTCHTSTYYWKAKFVPHPRIWGSVGVKLAVITKHRPTHVTRYALPTLPINPIIRIFAGGRAVLEARFPVAGGRELVVLNTHLDAFVLGTDVMQRQVSFLDEHLQGLDKGQTQWVLGGDLNLLPVGQYEKLSPDQQSYYNPQTEMQLLYDHFAVIPDPAALSGSKDHDWFTYYANDPSIGKPDRTLDYLIHSHNLSLAEAKVRQSDTQTISDHFPVVARFVLSAES